jgi:PTH1 family peptidyl-tRNA hydrolase
LNLDKLHFKTGGGLAGHNGLKSIAKCLGNQNFHRLRIGVGRPKHGSTADWVLGNFPKEQDQELGIVLEETSKALSFALKHGISKASNKYNKKNFLEIK